MNMPATLMWARGLDSRSVRITFDPPKNLGWVVATQLFPTDDPWTFTAPNLQYLMDSPTELSAQTIRTFKVRGADGREVTIRAAIHHDAGDAEVNEYVAGAEKIVQGAGRRVRRVSGVRARVLHVPRRLRALGWRRRDGAPEQHGRRRARVAAHARHGRRRARHGIARVLPRVERRAHPAEDARAVQFRGGEHLGRAVARRRVHAVLRRL